MHQTTVIPLSAVVIEPRVWPRRQVCQALVKELAEIYRHSGPNAIDPIVIARIAGDGRRVLADGRHRYPAAEMAGLTHLPVVFVDVKTEEEAYELAVRLSSKGPRKMTQGEKRDAIDRMLLANPNRSDRAIAEIVGVSHPLVASRRALLGKPKKLPGEGGGKRRVGRQALAVVKALRRLAEAAAWHEEPEEQSTLRERIETALARGATTCFGEEAAHWLELLDSWTVGACRRLEPGGFCRVAGSIASLQEGEEAEQVVARR